MRRLLVLPVIIARAYVRFTGQLFVTAVTPYLPKREPGAEFNRHTNEALRIVNAERRALQREHDRAAADFRAELTALDLTVAGWADDISGAP